MSSHLQSPPKRQRTGEGLQQGVPPSSVQCTATEFRAQAVSFLVSRNVDIRGPQAASLNLRPSLQKVHDDLMLVLNNAVQLKQNASVLVVGEPGVGKTLVLERVLRSAHVLHNPDPANPTLGAVRLSGVLHSEERAAFQEIAHQLCRTFNIPFSQHATFDDNISFFKQVLQELQRAFKTVVFVIDQLESFVKAAKQTLLYNMLDALTGSQVQAVVLGVSCCFDVQDMMEKRVRSRFSNRKIFIPGLSSGLDGQESPGAVLSSMLLLPDDFQPLMRTKQHNSCVHRALDNPEVKALLQQLCAIGVGPRELSVMVLSCLSAWEGMQGQQAGLSPSHLQTALKGWLTGHDSRVQALLGLSVLELCMLVAAQRLEDMGQPVFNFEMMLDEFMKVQQMQLGFMWNKQAAWRAFKDVVEQGLIAYTTARPGSKGMMQRYLPAQLRLARAELQRSLDLHDSCPDFVKKWLRGDAINSCLTLS
eukprot:gene2948-3233_t